MMKTCKWCGEVKSIDLFYRHPKLKDGRRPECKSCSNESRRMREEEHPVDTAIHRLSHGIRKRTVLDIDKPRNKYYKKNNIKCLIGDTTEEVRQTLDTYFRDDIKALIDLGEKPSVDRIDPKGHYELGNIEIVTFEENMRRSYKLATARPVTVHFSNGSTQEFESVKQAAKELNCKRDTIYSGAEKPGSNKRGLLFEIGEPKEDAS